MVAVLLIAAQMWTVEADQALVSIEVGGVSAVSHQLSGSIREMENGGVRVQLAAGAFDRLVKDGQLVFEGSAPAQDEDGPLRLAGTVTLHGSRRAITLPVSVTRVGGHAFAHAVLTLHLRDFGFELPWGASDVAIVQIDAGLRPDSVLASSG